MVRDIGGRQLRVETQILLPPVPNPGDNAGVAVHVGIETRGGQASDSSASGAVSFEVTRDKKTL